MNDKYYYKLYDELTEIVDEIRPYYNIDKIKTYAVYVLTKDDDYGYNVFDIESDKIEFYDKKHQIIEKALPIITKIQNKLKEIEIEGIRLKEAEEKTTKI